MYLKCSSEKSAQQQRLFEEALKRSMCVKLFENISISDLCRQTGLSRKTFYRLYETKADVVYAMIDHAILEAESFEPDASVTPGGMHRFFAFWKSQHVLLDALDFNRTSALLQQQAVVHVLREEPEVVACFGAGDSDYTQEMVMFYLSGLFALVQDWHRRGFDRSIDQMAELAMTLFNTPPVKEPLKINPY